MPSSKQAESQILKVEGQSCHKLSKLERKKVQPEKEAAVISILYFSLILFISATITDCGEEDIWCFCLDLL